MDNSFDSNSNRFALEETSDSNREHFGLSPRLWRIAIVTGIAQFSISIWTWQFSIFLEGIVEEWQIGLIFSVGTLLTLGGYLLCGIISDMFGRKATMIFSFIPLCTGLILLYLLPIWPLFLPFYGLTMFGWSFILIISKVVPADEIDENSKDSVRKFGMVLMPAFLVDGFSPLLGAFMLNNGFEQRGFLLLGFFGGLIAAISAFVVIQESIDDDVKEKARAGPKIAIRGLGRKFWVFTFSLMGFYFFFNAALLFFGNLVVNEWGIDTATFGLIWSAFSITSSLLMYMLTGIDERNKKKALIIALIMNAIIMLILGLGSGLFLIFILNIVWALPFVVWIGAERSIIVEGVSKEMKGRAMGTYTMFTMSTSIFAANFGALIWKVYGGLRPLWILCSLLEIAFILVIGIVLHLTGKDDTKSSLE